MIRVGTKITSAPLYSGSDLISARERYRGRVAYIHPKHRYIVAELEMPGGQRVRETFYFRRAGAATTAAERARGKYREKSDMKGK